MSNSNVDSGAEPLASVARKEIGDRVTIYKTAASPRWYIQYSEHGQQYRHTLRTQSQKQAEHLAKKKDAELLLGLPAKPPGGISIQKAIDDHVAFLELRGRASGTMALYRRYYGQFVTYMCSKHVTRLEQLTAQLLEAFQQELLRAGVTVRTPRRELPGA